MFKLIKYLYSIPSLLQLALLIIMIHAFSSKPACLSVLASGTLRVLSKWLKSSGYSNLKSQLHPSSCTRSYMAAPSNKPKASEVLTCHLENNGCPPWTSYFVRYDSIVDDQWGRSHFNWNVGNGKHNYHILRTGCYPYIKYHCSKRPHQDLRFEDAFFRFIKVFNLGLPCLAYGIAAIFMIRHTESVVTPKGSVTIYFLYPEDRGSSF